MSDPRETSRDEAAKSELSPVKRAFLAVDRLQARVKELEGARREPIAVVGVGCRFPGGVSSPGEYSTLLYDGVDAVSAEPPVARPGWTDLPGTDALPPAGYLDDDPAGFDPVFFGIAPREAASIDPQQRLALECAWHALEDAAINPRGLEGSRTGVFIGVAGTDWTQVQLRGSPGPEALHSHFAAGVGHSMVSGRVSYVLGLQGPSISVDTACSSSLVAVHSACQALRSEECDLALAGGVNLILAPDFTFAFQQSQMLAPDGRCRTFGADASGFTRGEGCGIVVLRRLRDAVRSGDRILAVVRGSAVNQDGPSSGLTAPNGPAQEAVIRDALRAADVEPASIGYVEAHGTATPLGDPIEVQALGAAYRKGRDPEHPLLLGSVKTNFGHLEAAAGIAGFIKVVLALKNGVVPPHLHFRTPSPHIPWEQLPVKVVTESTPFERSATPRRAGVSSFGFSGTNVHLILEEAPEVTESDPVGSGDRSVHVLPLSAGSRTGLVRVAEGVAGLLSTERATLPDVCHSAGVGRAPLPDRLAVVSDGAAEARDALRAWVAGAEVSGVFHGRAGPEPTSVAFLFAGQGSQRPGMGRELYDSEPVFRETLDRAAAVLDEELGRPFMPLVLSDETGASALEQTACAQPAIVAFEVALARLWRSWGVRPSRLLGHSVGEYAAAIDSGVVGFEDGLRLIAARGRLMQALPEGGAMAAVFAGPDRLSGLLSEHEGAVSLAAINAADSTVVSGDEAVVASLVERLGAEGVQSRRLSVSHAFHSRRMEPMLEAFRAVVDSISFSAPRTPLVSSVTGRPLTGAEAADPDYWCRQVRQPVRFAEGVGTLVDANVGALLEIGPDATLSGMASRTVAPDGARIIPSLRPGRGEEQALAEATAALYTAGTDVDWAARDDGRARPRIALPGTSFDRGRFWFVHPGGGRASATGPAWRSPQHPILGNGIRTPDGVWTFERTMEASTAPFIADHRVGDQVIVPATVHVELLMAAAMAAAGWPEVGIEDLTIREALVLEDGSPTSVQLRLEVADGARCRGEIYSLADGDESFRLHAEATLVRELEPAAEPVLDEGAAARCEEEQDSEAFYHALDQRGLHFGPAFRGVAHVRRTDGEALGVITSPDALGDHPYAVHPALLDAGIQVLAAAVTGGTGGRLYLPLGMQGLRVFPGAGVPVRSHARLADPDGASRSLVGSVALFDEAGAPVVTIESIQLVETEPPRAAGPSPLDWAYKVTWERRPAIDTGAPHAPTPETVAAAAEEALRSLATEHGAGVYGDILSDLESLSVGYIVRGLRALGWSPTQDETVTSARLVSSCGVLPRHERLIHRLLRVLEGAGGLVPLGDGEGWRVARALDDGDVVERGEQLCADHAPHNAELAVLARCGAGLAGALDGSTDPLELLFPGGDTSDQARVYRDTPIAKTYNGALRAVVDELASAWPRGRPFRVLEIGAGTGGTTAHVLGVLPEAGVEYTFTDVGRLFVNRAREEFGDRTFMRFDVLDIGEDPIGQGFDPGSFDLILASNVLHATTDLRTTLRHVESLLAPGGTLCVLEVTRARGWVDLTVGLTEGWWLYEDTDLRAENPVLSREGWLALLEEVGFERATASREWEEDSGLGGQTIVVARRGEVDDRPSGRRWVVFADSDGVAEDFAARVAGEGADLFVIHDGPELRCEQNRATVPIADRDAVQALFSGADGPMLPWLPSDVALFNAVDASGDEVARLERTLAGTLHVVQALVTMLERTPRLHLVTRFGQPAGGDAEAVDPVQAALWGMARSVDVEHPELRCQRIDLDGAGWTDAAHRQLMRPDGETQVAIRGEERLVARLVSVPLTPPGDVATRRLHYGGSGSLDDLVLRSVPRVPPGPQEIEIEVLAAGMNFRDVVHALGVRSDVEALGAECVGRVSAVGDQVSRFETGDLVLAARGAFGDYVTIHAGLAVAVPRGLSLAAAATLPITFLTADRALREGAAMQAGQRILIHAAAGGVGMAAVQLAVAEGLEVYGTASTDEKRQRVRELGACDVFDSRSLTFEQDVMRVTEGAGVHIVLNSLAGDFIPASLRVLTEGGVLVELGKTEEWDDARARSQNGVRAGVRYVPIDLSDDLLHRPERITPALESLVGRVSNAELAPLPFRTYPLDRAEEAFRTMAAGLHTGKLVLIPPDGPVLRRDGAYLITGGLSGLGLRTAERFVERGAGAVVLVGRSAASAEAESAIEGMRAQGARVDVLRADVSDRVQFLQALAGLEALPPIRGVVHSAGTLADGAIVQQNWGSFLEVLGPKALGVRNLEAAVGSSPVDFFLIYSSMASVLGSAGQANHSAANAFLDAVAVARRAHGTPGVSLAWGAWDEIGAAARRGANERAAQRGLGSIHPESGMMLTERLAVAGHPAVMVSPVDWSTFAEDSGSAPFLERVAAIAPKRRTSVPRRSGEPASAGRSVIEELEATPSGRRHAVLRHRVQAAALRVLGLPADYDLDDRQPLADIGLDSLMAVELRNALGRLLDRTLPATLLFEQPTVAALTTYLGKDILGADAVAERPVPTGGPSSAPEDIDDIEAMLGRIEGLSEEEVERDLRRDSEAGKGG